MLHNNNNSREELTDDDGRIEEGSDRPPTADAKEDGGVWGQNGLFIHYMCTIGHWTDFAEEL